MALRSPNLKLRRLGRFEPAPNCTHVAKHFDGRDVISHLYNAYKDIAQTQKHLWGCKYFQFLDREYINRLTSDGSSVNTLHFWLQSHQLMIFSRKSIATATFALLEGISWSIGQMNALSLALHTRALIEQSCAADFLSLNIRSHTDRLRSEVWTKFQKNAAPPPNLQDRSVHRELLRFATGQWTRPLGETFDQSDTSTWERFYESVRSYEPHADDSATELRYILNRQKGIPGREHFRVVHSRLSDFCHPNGPSRTAEFRTGSVVRGVLHFVASDLDDSVVASGFREVFNALRSVAIGSLSAIVESLHILERSRMTINNDPAGSDSNNPLPMNTMEAVDVHGRRIAVSTRRIDNSIDPERMVEL